MKVTELNTQPFEQPPNKAVLLAKVYLIQLNQKDLPKEALNQRILTHLRPQPF